LLNPLDKKTRKTLDKGMEKLPDLKQKKYVYLWTKYSLESRRNVEKRKAFKEKFKEYLGIAE
jgi:hypothetical protein